MSKEAFEEWYPKQDDYIPLDDNYYSKLISSHTWNHQQKKIDQLHFDKAKMREEYKQLESLNKHLTAQIERVKRDAAQQLELLTRCSPDECIEMLSVNTSIGSPCQGCKNKALLEKDKV